MSSADAHVVNGKAPTVGTVTYLLLRHPIQRLWWRWNWKSAVTSALFRAALFFVVNLGAGLGAALAALNTELVLRFSTSGFYGAITQAFRHARPAWAATLAIMVLMPLLSHGLELVVHWQRQTARLGISLLASVAFTMISTAFNIYAMRRGALVVGENPRPFLEDLRRMPGLWLTFLATPCFWLFRRVAQWRARMA